MCNKISVDLMEGLGATLSSVHISPNNSGNLMPVLRLLGRFLIFLRDRVEFPNIGALFSLFVIEIMNLMSHLDEEPMVNILRETLKAATESPSSPIERKC